MLTEVVPALQERLRRLGGYLFVAHLVAIFGIALSNVFLALTGLTLTWSRAWATADHRRLRPLWWTMGAYVVCLLGAAFASRDPSVSLPHVARDVLSLATLVLAVLVVRGESEVRRAARWVQGAATAFALVGLAQPLWGYGGIDQRIRGPFSHYMTFSGVLLLADLLMLSRVVVGQGWRKKRYWVALTVINAALAGSLTRTAWVALAIPATALLALRRPRWLAGAALAGVVLFLVLPVPVVERATSIFDLDDSSNYDRLCMAEAGMLMIADRPLLGTGPGMVRRWYPIYRHPTAPRFWVPHLHNAFLQLGASGGLVTLAAFLAMVGVGLREGWRLFREQGGLRGPRADLLVGGILAVVAFGIAGLFEDNWSDSEVQRIFLFALAVPFCLGQRPSRLPEEAET